jgi:diguanylate cyclase (GGDEF)-like protein
MDKYDQLNNSIKKLSRDLWTFIELSLKESESSWGEWIASMAKRSVNVKCWETKQCKEEGCPAYMNTCGRCWLIAGTMCGGEVQGKYAQKYKTCCECDVYQEGVFQDPMAEVYEHVLTLVHSLKSKQEELKHLATTDMLTGLFNRNYFYISVEREIEKILRSGGRPLFVMIDINNFKYVNDRHGHQYGDKVLKEAASVLNKSTRTSNLLVRLGGDEFLILLPSFTGGEKEALVRRIRRHTYAWNGKWATSDYKLSFSTGHSVLDPGKKLEDCLSEADTRMYRHKARYK